MNARSCDLIAMVQKVARGQALGGASLTSGQSVSTLGTLFPSSPSVRSSALPGYLDDSVVPVAYFALSTYLVSVAPGGAVAPPDTNSIAGRPLGV